LLLAKVCSILAETPAARRIHEDTVVADAHTRAKRGEVVELPGERGKTPGSR
jgi:hypothetical protein